MRGHQIAAERSGWRATNTPSRHDVASADIVVITKDINKRDLDVVKESGAPIIYDALDFWKQTKLPLIPFSHAQRLTSVEMINSAFKSQFQKISPDAIVCVTQQMANDLKEIVEKREVIYHHSDPRLPSAELYFRSRRNEALALLYYGKVSLMGEWRRVVTAACKSLGIEFIAFDIGNGAFEPPPFCSAMLAVRADRGSWLARRWKSNVKAATAAHLGVPFIAWPESAYTETAPEAYWFRSESELKARLEEATSANPRLLSRVITAADSAVEFERVAADVLEAR